MLLEVKNLVVEVEGKRVLNGVNLAIREGETHVLLGPNGAGKSTLFLTILGFPKYKVVEGSIIFNGEDITDLTTTERVQRGLGVSFQNPPAIRGVSVRDLLKLESKQDPDEELNPRMKALAEKQKNKKKTGISTINKYYLDKIVDKCKDNNIPIAKYDIKSKKAYLEYSDGSKTYIE